MDAHNRNEEGMTLVELIVAVVVAALVLGVISVSFVNGMIAQRDGVARDSATGRANVVVSSISASIRNAASFRVSADGMRLDATFITANGTPQCRAWAVVRGADNKMMLVYRADESDPTNPVPAVDASWTPLATDVKGTLTGDTVFATAGDKNLQWGMIVRVGVGAEEHVDATVADGVTAQAFREGAPTC